MTDAVSPRHYVFREFHLKWHPLEMEEGKPRPPLNMTQLVGYQVEQNHDVPLAYRITLNITTHSEQEPRAGYEAHVQVVGTFTVPEAWTPQERDWRVRVDGLVRLYELTRHQLDLSSRTFPGGRLVLPELDMEDIVRRYEAGLRQHDGDEALAPTPKAKKATATTGKPAVKRTPRTAAGPAPDAKPRRRPPRRPQA
jgi:hypothetical protein